MPRDRKRDEENKPGSPAWMTTFGDMMTLLLVFFVLLYSFSVMDIEKFQGFISALKAQLGVLEGGRTISEREKMSKGMEGENFNPQANFHKIMSELNQFIQEEGLEQQVSMEVMERGLVIRLTGQILYDLGEAKIKPAGEKVLHKIGNTIVDVPNNVMVEGHTDDLPINNDNFPSNWELSTTRATNVIKFFIENHEIVPGRLSAAGYSQYRPLYDNDTPEHRAKNRRVEIVIKNLERGQVEVQDGRRE